VNTGPINPSPIVLLSIVLLSNGPPPLNPPALTIS
jgi:hypothetical protein